MENLSVKEFLPYYHIQRTDWLFTTQGEERGYIQPQHLKELWFHTGTICNLSCPFCLEGSKPGDNRLNSIILEDVIAYFQEAVDLSVEKFCFTGGEPFVIRDIIKILDYALTFKPCLVLTNATQPLKTRLKDILYLREKPHSLNFRVSLDYPDPQKHDAARGNGSFKLALSTLGELYRLGFGVSIARQRVPKENAVEVEAAYSPYLKEENLPSDLRIVSFPDFLTPGSWAPVPQITETCMTRYHTKESREKFMCHYSKMIVKRNGKMRVYACTLVDDDEDYDLGATLTESMKIRIMLKHHRCYSCFAHGASCSELSH